MKKIITLALAALFAGSIASMALPIPGRAEAQAAVFQSELDLDDEQTEAIKDGLVIKLTNNKKANKLRKAGDKDGAKVVYKQTGKVFYGVLKDVLTKEQMKQYKEKKKEIMSMVQAIK